MFAQKKMQAAIILATGLLCLPTFADAPGEAFHVAYQDISREVLRRTIGILTINSRARQESTLQTYSGEAGQLVPAALLQIAQTTPISNFGYHPPHDSGSFENYRYPIVEKAGSHVKFVYNPVKNLSAWIDLAETEKHFSTSVTMLHDLNALRPFFIDIFHFTENRKRKFYRHPGKPDDFFIVEESRIPYGLLKVMDMREGYLQLGKPHFNDSTFEIESIEPVGWIRMRDDSGQITFWVRDEDLC